MAAAAHTPGGYGGVPQSVGREFNRADAGSGILRRDAGGGVMAAGAGMPGAGIMSGGNPALASQMQRYAQLPIEKLQELAARLGNSQQGMMVRRALQQKMMAPQQDTMPQEQPQQSGLGVAQAGPSGPMYRGGGIAHRAGGGGSPLGMSMSMASPWWERSEARMADSGGAALLHSPVAGRTDHLPVTAPPGSYVIPADVVSGLGEGNTLAGARIMQEALATGPWGTPLSRGHGGHSIPAPPHPSQYDSRGGRAMGGQHVPIMAAGGEMVIHPFHVARIGHGSLSRGHAILDRWVVKKRQQIAKGMLKLPGPKGGAYDKGAA
jgi:hypothetical protein